MVTRSLTIIKDGDQELACIYNQYDGYLDGIGDLIAQTFRGMKVVNGYRAQDQINGMGDLAVRLICAMKGPENVPGNVYVYPANDPERYAQEYNYTIWAEGERVMMRAESGDFQWTGHLDLFDGKAIEKGWNAEED